MNSFIKSKYFLLSCISLIILLLTFVIAQEVYENIQANKIQIISTTSQLTLTKYTSPEKDNYKIEIDEKTKEVCFTVKDKSKEKDNKKDFYTSKDKSKTIKIDKTTSLDGKDKYCMSNQKYIQLGENTIILEEQAQKKVTFIDTQDVYDYEFDENGTIVSQTLKESNILVNISATLYKDLNSNRSDTVWSNSVEDVFVYYNQEKWKFGANDSSNTNVSTYKYLIESNQQITLEDGHFVTSNYEISLSDICSKTYANCQFTLSNTILEVVFDSDSIIDPSFSVVTTATGFNLVNLTNEENALIHLDVDTAQTPYTNLVGYWSFDGRTFDTGQVGLSRFFSGADYITVPATANGNIDKTISFWLKPSAGIISTYVVGRYSGDNYVYYDATNQLIYMRDGSGSDWIASATNSVPKSSWTFITMNYQATGTMGYLYVNGVLAGSSVVSSTLWDDYMLTFGGSTNGYFNGSMDEVTVFNRSLSTGEIYSLYRRGLNNLNNNITSGLVAEWRLENNFLDSSGSGNHASTGGGGTVFDVSPNNKDGTYFANAYSGAGLYDNAGVFDGDGDYINIPQPMQFTQNNQTFSFWLKIPNAYATNTILSEGAWGAGSRGWNIGLVATTQWWGHTAGYLAYNLQDVSPGGSIQLAKCNYTNYTNQWTFITAVKNRGTGNLSLYINGVKCNEGTGTAVAGETNDYQTTLKIGRASWTATYYLNGSIDELMIFNTTLTDAQILDIYNNQSLRFKNQGTAELLPQVISQSFSPNNINLTLTKKTSQNSIIQARLGAGDTKLGYNTTLYSGLTGYWAGDGNYNDYLGLKNGTASGSVNATSTGFYNNSFGFNGVSGLITTSYALPQTNFTILAWIKPVGWGGANFGRITDDSSAFYDFIVASGKLGFRGGNYYSPASSIVLNSWQHAVVVVNQYNATSNNATFYINGIAQPSGLISIAVVGNLLIGDKSIGGRTFNGYIDDVMFFNRTLSSSEINSLYFDGLLDWNYTAYQNYNSTSTQETKSFNVATTTTNIKPDFILIGNNTNNNLSFYTPYLFLDYSYSYTDNLFPTISITSPLNNAYMKSPFTVTFTGTEANILEATVTVNNINYSASCTGNPTYTCTYTASLTEGAYYNISAYIKDDSGNFNQTSVAQIRIDSNAPTGTLSPANDTWAKYPNLTISASDTIGIKNISLWINGVLNTTFTFVENTLTATVGVVVYLADVTYTWFYQVYDWASNLFTSDTYNINIDNTNASVQFNSQVPADLNLSNFMGPAGVNISYNISDLITVGDVSGGTASQNGAGGSFEAYDFYFDFRVFAYRELNGVRIYSSNGHQIEFTDDGTSNYYSIDLSWDTVANADGYRVIINQDDSSGYYGDKYFDVATNSATYLDGVSVLDGNTVTPTSLGIGLNTSTIKLYYKSNDSLSNIMYYQNGTAHSGYFSESPTDNVSSTYRWNLLDNSVLTGTYNYGEITLENTVHYPAVSLSNQNQYLWMEFLNVSNSTQYGFLETMSNSTSVQRIYYCNSSYTTGNPTTSTFCTNFYTIPANNPFQHTHTSYSKHQVIPFTVNTTSGKIGNIAVTPTSYFLIRGNNGAGNGVYYHYISATARANAFKTTSSNGGTWTANDTIFVDAHIHQFGTNYSIWYYACANDSLNNGNCSSPRQDLFEFGGLPPTAPNVYSPNESLYSNNIDINYTASISPNGYSISYYAIDLLHSNLSTYKNLVPNTLNLSYIFNSKSVLNGEYFIKVTVYDSIGQSSYDLSENFTISNPSSIVEMSVVGGGGSPASTIYLNDMLVTMNTEWQPNELYPILIRTVDINKKGVDVDFVNLTFKDATGQINPLNRISAGGYQTYAKIINYTQTPSINILACQYGKCLNYTKVITIVELNPTQKTLQVIKNKLDSFSQKLLAIFSTGSIYLIIVIVVLTLIFFVLIEVFLHMRGGKVIALTSSGTQ